VYVYQTAARVIFYVCVRVMAITCALSFQSDSFVLPSDSYTYCFAAVETVFYCIPMCAAAKYDVVDNEDDGTVERRRIVQLVRQNYVPSVEYCRA